MRFLTLAGFFLLLVAGTMTSADAAPAAEQDCGPTRPIGSPCKIRLFDQHFIPGTCQKSGFTFYSPPGTTCKTNSISTGAGAGYGTYCSPVAFVAGFTDIYQSSFFASEEQAKLPGNFNCRAVVYGVGESKFCFTRLVLMDSTFGDVRPNSEDDIPDKRKYCGH
ncbi:hypothetical protein F5879DRAFT_927611 [Lentinula edodes]|nr:hypothetical protein F5879DRAFT_927611 [Lentinula edodes]